MLADTVGCRAAGGPRHAQPRRAARFRAARHVRGAVRRDRSDRRPIPERGQAARQPGPPEGAGKGRRLPTPILPASERSSTRSSLPRAAVTSTRSSHCSTRTSCSSPTPPPWAWARRRRSRGAAAVAGTFSGRALAAQPALIDGAVGVVWAVGGRPKVVWDFTIRDGKVVHIDMLAAATASTTSTSRSYDDDRRGDRCPRPNTSSVRSDGSNHRSSTGTPRRCRATKGRRTHGSCWTRRWVRRCGIST